MSVGDTSNPEYVTARVRTRRSVLFDDEDYRQLIRMGPSEIARFMEETTYGPEINALGARHAGVDLIEYALNHNLARHFNDLLRWADGPLYDQIARYLRKFDAWNIKTILRGFYASAEREVVEDDLIRAGEFHEHFVDELLGAESIEEAIDLLDSTIFGGPLSSAFNDYERSGLLVPLENAVDRAYYEHLMAGISDPDDRAMVLYVDFLQAEIDFLNIRNALRIARSGADIDVADYFIEGGRLFDATELAGLSSSVDELSSRIRNSIYGEQLTEALQALEDADDLIAFERRIEAALLAYSDHLSHVYPLSVCPVLAFILMKEREVDNIRAISRGVEVGLGADEIEEELVIL